jgi:flagellar basal body rod protein FlgC
MNSIIPVSGLQLASQRFANSAHNVANLSTAGFMPSEVVASSVEPQGGVSGARRVREPVGMPPSQPKGNALYMANQDIVQAEYSVSLEQETAEQILSKNAFMSNLRSLSATLTMQQSLLDIAV